MKKSIMLSVVFTLVLTCFALVGTTDANAAAEESQFEWKCNYYNNTAKLVDYVGNDTDVQVPQEIDGCKVTEIGERAFSYSDVIRVELPNTIKVIGENAFESCRSLRQINLPSSVTEIQSYTFSECISLESIKLPDGLNTLGSKALAKCTSLTNVTIPKNVKELEWGAFELCKNLQSVSISTPSKLEYIGNYAFSDCETLKTINLPSSLKDIGYKAFNDCKALSSIKFSVGLQGLSAYAFSGCVSLESIVIPNTVKELDMGTFGGCTSLKKAIIYGSPYTGWADDFFTPTNILTVYGYAGSTVQEMAKEEGYRFVALNKPTSLKGSVLSKKYSKLTWKAAKGAKSYEVYRSSKKSSGYTKVAETTNVTYTDKKVKRGSAYYYKLRMYLYDPDGVKLFGDYTKPVTVKILKK